VLRGRQKHERKSQDGCRSSSARRAEVLASGIKRELRARAVSGHGLILGEIVRGNPLSQSDGMIVVAERGQATHAQSEQCKRYQGGWDQGKEYDDLRLGDQETSRSTL